MATIRPLKRFCPKLVIKSEFGYPSYYGTVIRVEDQSTVVAQAFMKESEARVFMRQEAARLNNTRGPVTTKYF